jgi:transcription antitermination factor NusA-like protein
MKDEIVVSGEKDGVLLAKDAIMKVYEEKSRKTITISVEVKKSQHKYIIGLRASGLTEILAATGVSVEMPSPDNSSETITLRGDPDKLGPALTMLYSKANSIEVRTVTAPLWLRRHIIGRQGANIRKITNDLPRVHIEFSDDSEEIKLEGPPEDAEHAEKIIQDLVTDLINNVKCVELNIDPKFHRHIVGKSGANVNRLKNELGVDIRIPPDSEHSPVVRIEGSADAVEKAKAELLDLVEKVENEKSRDLVVEHRLHRLIIGNQGRSIREMRDLFPSVNIFIPDQSRNSDIITLRGPKNDVDRCYTHLQKHVNELKSANVVGEVRVYSRYLKEISSALRKIREDTETRIDVPSDNSNDNTVVLKIYGTKDGIERARELIENKQKTLGHITELTVEIPHVQHAALQGSKGQLLRAVRDECGGIMIHFPAPNVTSDKILLRGPSDDVNKAKELLLDLANDTTNSRMTAELHAKPEYHRFLIGRNGIHLRELLDRTGARVIFPNPSDGESDTILIIGKQEAIDKARRELETKIRDLDNVVEEEMLVDQRHHRHFVSRKCEVLHQVAEEHGGISISFPRFGVKSDKVVLKGPAECVKSAKTRILDIVHDLESQVSVECIIPSKHHRVVLGQRGHRVQEITRTHCVNIKFPDRNTENKDNKDGSEQVIENGDENGSEVRRQDVIVITGKPEDCEAAKQALMSLVPVTEEMAVPMEYHGHIIGKKGSDVRRLMEEYEVNISVPPSEDCVDVLRITGPPNKVEQAKVAIGERIKQLDEEKHERELKNFKLEVMVEPKYHPKIIGRRGAVVTKIRQDHDVHILFPDKNSDRPDVIVITGLQEKTESARDEITRIVQELEDLVSEEVDIDHRIHSRIIGARGRAIHKIMEEFHVDVRFPGRDSENPNLVVITGREVAVLVCRDKLLELEDEYLQDVSDREYLNSFSKDTSDGQASSLSVNPVLSEGFAVKGAPWSAPDTNSMDDFPDLGAVAAPPHSSPSRLPQWGPRR